MNKLLAGNKPLFCEQYWKNIKKNTKPSKDFKPKVSTSFYFHEVNNYFINGNPKAKKYLEHDDICMPVQRFLAKSDKEFKELTPTKEELILWRGISPPLKKAKKRNMRYEQAYNCKAGNIVCMPEYAFATDKMKHALLFAKHFILRDGILYEIQVPEGSKIHRSVEYVFPRYSKFECLGTQNMENEGIRYKLIKLKYIQPKEIKLSLFEKIMRYFKK